MFTCFLFKNKGIFATFSNPAQLQFKGFVLHFIMYNVDSVKTRNSCLRCLKYHHVMFQVTSIQDHGKSSVIWPLRTVLPWKIGWERYYSLLYMWPNQIFGLKKRKTFLNVKMKWWYSVHLNMSVRYESIWWRSHMRFKYLNLGRWQWQYSTYNQIKSPIWIKTPHINTLIRIMWLKFQLVSEWSFKPFINCLQPIY